MRVFFYVNRHVPIVTTCLHLGQTLATSADYIDKREQAHIQTRNETYEWENKTTVKALSAWD